MIEKNYFPKLRPEPIEVYVNGNTYILPREKLLAAYAGATAFFEKDLNNQTYGLLFGKKEEYTFREEYKRALPECIEASNHYLSATWEMLDYYNPSNRARNFLKEKAEHNDNPLYPFLEEID